MVASILVFSLAVVVAETVAALGVGVVAAAGYSSDSDALGAQLGAH